VPPGIIWVVLDEVALEDDSLDLRGPDESMWARHLLHRVRQEEDSPPSRVTNLLDYLGHTPLREVRTPGGQPSRRANLTEVAVTRGPTYTPDAQCQVTPRTLTS